MHLVRQHLPPQRTATDSFTGAPGFNVFVQPLLEDLNPTLRADPLETRNMEQPEIIDLSQDRILTTASSLEQSLQRLRVLVVSNPSPGLCRRIMRPIIVQLWILASQEQANGDGSTAAAARILLQIYMRLFGKTDTMNLLRQNVLCQGSTSEAGVQWLFQAAADGKAQIVVKRPGSGQDEISWVEIEAKASILTDVLRKGCSAEDVSALFRDLLRSWIRSASENEGITLSTAHGDEDPNSALQELFEMILLQKLLEQASEKLVSDFDQLLELICHVLKGDEKTPMADELMGVVLSLLNLVITAPTFKKSDIKAEELAIIENGLDRLRSDGRAVSQTASNLSLLLRYRGDMDEEEEATSAPSKRQVEDRRIHNLAMNYITEADNPPPVVSEGLSLLSGLIVSESSILDITATLVLMSNLLANSEDYINLRVVKVFTQLAGKHPKSTVTELLDHYLDAQEKSSTDTRLRFGEALLQVVERLGETFTGDVAQQVGEALLSIAGRRGYRPKTKRKKEKEERMKDLKRKKADLQDDDDELESEDEILEGDNEIIAQIVKGWDSKRGFEDIRMRASALSIFGRALETNISGLGPTLASGGVDLCANVLTLEPELEKAILRRSAIVAVLSFARALQQAKDSGRSLGFGLTDASRQDITRTLEYVAGTDNDGMVQQHARDVVESLENWQMSTLLPQQNAAEASGLARLAGLSVEPEIGLTSPSERPRPRIEEIE